MDAAIYEKIAHNAESDHEVEAEKREVMVEEKVEAIQRCVEEAASSDKEQSPMQLGLLAPCNRKDKGRAKSCHGEERNDEEGLGPGLVELVRIEAAHYDGGCGTERNHRRAEGCSEPPEEAMPIYVSRANQNGLKHEEYDPA